MSTGQKWLTAAIAALALVLAPLFFIVMFVTVNGLLGPGFDGWAWAVPVATELSFVLLYLLELLMTWLGAAPGWLRALKYPFAAGSLLLNVYAGRGSVASATGHAMIVVAFFAPLIAGKSAVRRLATTPADRERATAAADARAHARDILRAELGPAWRLRAPVLLRRQLRTGRLPAPVLAAIESGLGYGGATIWEPAVRSWVAGELTHGDRLRASVAHERRAIVTASGDAPAATAPASRQPVAVRQKPVSERDRKRRRASDLVASNPRVSAAEMARQCGISKRTAERWRAEMTRPRLVAGDR